MTQTPTFPEMFRKALNARLVDLHIALPGRVESYDASKVSVDVLPLIKRIDSDESGARVARELPIIPSVPLIFPGIGDYRITFPVKKGDLVLLIFVEASIAKWLESGTVVDPLDDRRNQLIDAVAIPGLRSFKKPYTPADTSALVIEGSMKLGSQSATKKAAFNDDLEGLRAAIAGAGTGDAIPGIVGALGPYTGASKVKVE